MAAGRIAPRRRADRTPAWTGERTGRLVDVEPNIVPEPVVTLVQTWRARDLPAQSPIAWPRSRWLAALPEYEAALRALPDKLGRDDVREACLDAAVGPASATAGFVAAMVWGFGDVGYGQHRTRQMLSTPDAPWRLHTVAETLASDGPLAAYGRLARAADCRLLRLGPAFGTKYLYFAQPRPAATSALILDDLVAFWLDCRIMFRLDAVTWSASTYQRYLERMHAWADALGCAPEDLERCMFQDEVRRRDEAGRRRSQWGLTADPS